MTLRLALVLVAALSVAAPAHAREIELALSPESPSYGFARDRDVAGPVLAGDHVVVAHRHASGLLVSAFALDGPSPPPRSVPLPADAQHAFALSAAAGRLAVVHYSFLQADSRNPPETVAQEVLTGGFAGPLDTLARCERAACGVDECSGLRAGVAGAATALFPSTGCGPGRLTIRAADGFERTFERVDGLDDLRGNFVAYSTVDTSTPVVANWRTGEIVHARTGPVIALDDDGAVVLLQRDGSLARLAPRQTRPRPLPVAQRRGEALEIAAGGGVVAYAGRNRVRGMRVGAVTRAGVLRELRTGRGPRFPDASPLGRVTTDGRRLAWAAQPCAAVSVFVWTLSAAPPRLPERCGMPRVAPAPPVVRPEPLPGDSCSALCEDVLLVPLVCPDVAGGCAGRLQVDARGRHHEGLFRVPAGQTGRAAVRVYGGAVRGRGVRITVRPHGVPRAGWRSVVRRVAG